MSHSELLVEGYIRQICKNNKDMSVPTELIVIILIFYPKQYQIFAIGYAVHNQFGLHNEWCTQWKYLSKMSSLCYHPNLISKGCQSYFTINLQKNKLYAMGRNYDGSLGVTSTEIIIKDFTEIKFPDIDTNKYELDVINKKQLSTFSITSFKSIHDDNKQIFYTFGKNQECQQGHQSKDVLFPQKSASLGKTFKEFKIIQISSGQYHTLFLTSSGNVFSCGNNEVCQCGVSTMCQNVVKPQIIPFLYDIINIASGGYHNLCIDKNNAVWVFGSNEYGELGLGHMNDQDTAIMNPHFKGNCDENKIVFVDCGESHTMCISKDGKAYLFGENGHGQCGNGISLQYVKCGNAESLQYVRHPFCVNETMKNTMFESGSCGMFHTLLVSSDNTLYGFGYNHYYQTGNTTSDDDQVTPYMISTEDIGVDKNATIVKVICDHNATIVICEV